jgi:Cytochrome c554 and c-prime
MFSMTELCNINRRWVIVFAVTGWLATTIGMTPSAENIDPRNTQQAVNVDPHKVVGAESCEKCHASEVSIWKQTPHFGTFQTLHRKPEAQQIANRMGVTSFKENSDCMKCHYTLQSKAPAVEAIAGVSCESCHGAAKDWLNVHSDYGGAGVTRESETPENRTARLKSSIRNGMRNPVNVYMVAQSCYRCHTVPDEKLVNVGGHKEGSMDFEFVAWSQGAVRHNFLRSNGKSNDVSSPERLRVMFVSGMIADLEFSLRATAAATEKATFGINSAQRASRAAKRLAAAQTKINQPLLEEILQVFNGVKLKLNNEKELEAAAEAIATLGVRFAASVKGEQLEAIDPFIPPADRWKAAF